MAIRNRFIFVPLCLCLFSASSFSSNDATGKEISAYASAIRDYIIAKGGGVFNKYKGKACVVRLHISRNGAFSFNIDGGDPDLCNQLSVVLNSMKKFPPPPSEDIYLRIKDGKLDFKL